MSQTAAPPELWIRQESAQDCRQRLHRTVAALARARHLQMLLDHAFAGLLAGLSLATLVVLVARFGQLSLPLAPIVAGIVAFAVAIALAVGWWRRPDPLRVAIRADLALRLKQRLSTAWELITIEGDTALSDRLAMHAVRAGLPVRPATVFPLRVNRWGKLAPLAATALLLASVVDLNRLQASAPPAVDERVVGEGERLSAFGRDMQTRAQREDLPRSTREGTQLERLGARMQSGSLSRSHALEQLRRMTESLDQNRTEALAEAGAGPGAAGSRQAASVAREASALLERMERGALGRGDASALGERLDDLERAGIPRRQAEQALEQHRAGADEPLKDILEKLAQIDRALREDEEMRRALEAVRRSQDALGSPRARSNDTSDRPSIDWGEDESGPPGARGGASTTDRRGSGELALQMPRTGAQGDSSSATGRPATPLAPKPAPQGPVLSAQGQMREGESFETEGRILPRTNRPNRESTSLDPEFESQVEAVLANEQYPAHYKAFVRRYFLGLSQGEPGGSEQP